VRVRGVSIVVVYVAGRGSRLWLLSTGDYVGGGRHGGYVGVVCVWWVFGVQMDGVGTGQSGPR
jgi:hypothetical protein